jgi:teichuronic acid biosynthesis glycosyltransferase TuaH
MQGSEVSTRGMNTWLVDKFGKARRFVADQGLGPFLAFVTHRTLGPFIGDLFKRPRERRLKDWLDRRCPRGARTYIVWSTLDWRYPYRQRPQHLAKAIAQSGKPVIYVTTSSGHDRVVMIDGVMDDVVLTPSADAAICQTDAPVLVLLSTDTRWNERHLDEVRAKGGVIVYDYLDALDDALSRSPITEERRILHDRLLRDEAHTVIVSVAEVLGEEVASRRSRHHAVVTNGVDVEPFKAAARGGALRKDFAAVVARGRPIIGYYGSLAAWFDYELMLKLAKERPGYEIVTIGPDLDGSSAAFEGHPPNLHVLPGMNYDDLPRHGVWFEVCLVPFVMNDITLATSPLKIFEYMAMQAPIVSTPMPECRKYRSILIGEDHSDFVAKVDVALALRGDGAHRSLLLQEAEANSWGAKVAQIDALVDGLLAEKRMERAA